MTRPAAIARKPRTAALRLADARRAGRAAMETGCTVEVTTPTGLRFRFTPAGESKPERNPWDDAEA